MTVVSFNFFASAYAACTTGFLDFGVPDFYFGVLDLPPDFIIIFISN